MSQTTDNQPIVNEIVKMDPQVQPRSILPYSEVMQLAQAMAGSGYFKDAREANQAVVKILVGQELGFGPAASMMGISIVEGKPSLGANLIAAAIKASPKYDFRVSEHTDLACEIMFFERGEEVGRSRFDMKQAAAAGLASKLNWKNYPRNMLFARAMSNGAKWYAAEVFGGVPVYYEGEIEVKSSYSGQVNQTTGEVVDAQIVEDKPKREKTPTPDGKGAFGHVPAEWPKESMFAADPSDKQIGALAALCDKAGLKDDGDRHLACELISRAYGVYDGMAITSTKQLSKGAVSLCIDWWIACEKDAEDSGGDPGSAVLYPMLSAAMDKARGQGSLMGQGEGKAQADEVDPFIED